MRASISIDISYMWHKSISNSLAIEPNGKIRRKNIKRKDVISVRFPRHPIRAESNIVDRK